MAEVGYSKNKEVAREVIPKGAATLTIKRSRFIAEVFDCADEKDAHSIIKLQKVRYKDASHLVSAFICGKGGTTMYKNDNGEPPGTAGVPLLNALRSAGAENTLVTVARYFGGTKLGRPGLIKAYKDVAVSALSSIK